MSARGSKPAMHCLSAYENRCIVDQSKEEHTGHEGTEKRRCHLPRLVELGFKDTVTNMRLPGSERNADDGTRNDEPDNETAVPRMVDAARRQAHEDKDDSDCKQSGSDPVDLSELGEHGSLGLIRILGNPEEEHDRENGDGTDGEIDIKAPSLGESQFLHLHVDFGANSPPTQVVNLERGMARGMLDQPI